MRSIEVRPSRPDDARIARLLGTLDEYLHRQYPVEEWGTECNHILDVQALLQPSITFVAAWEGDSALGCGAIRRLRDGEGDFAEVKRMFVRPEARGQRVGERMLLALEDAVRAEGIRRVFLETGVRQPEALRLYERCGFTRRGPFGEYEDHPASIFMGKRL
ncbi:MAG TPA: GNAT family N-acetyltransferase [Ramlibacter sp.]|uniref:GNAT family N-acetyltransferase n=1 Tax=Ramlibacter sp. TaxID=1917967 RepID=UPI002C2EC92E|nr:GNAT family N-acetyltransferase [Ramlibacter sp.]HVZ42996.1 GNAT family N-acetyltransferase [Ramlibacter sp.]